MKVEEKIYSLGTESGQTINETDNLLLVVNDIRTNLYLRDLFYFYKQGKSEIRGSSILGNYEIKDNKIIIEDMELSIVNKNDDQNIYFTRYEEPVFQRSDKEIDEIKYISMIRQSLKEINPSTKEEEKTFEEKTDEFIEFIEEEVKTEDEIKEEPFFNEEEVLEKFPEGKYKTERDLKREELTSKGLKHFEFDNYDLYYNEQLQKVGLYIFEDEKIKNLRLKKVVDVSNLKEYEIEGQENKHVIFDFETVRVINN